MYRTENLIFLFVCHSIHTRLALQNSASSSLLSPPTSTRRRGSSVMFNEFVILHTPPTIPEPQNDKNALSVEKMTQTGEGIWQVSGIFISIKLRMAKNSWTEMSFFSFLKACESLVEIIEWQKINKMMFCRWIHKFYAWRISFGSFRKFMTAQ